MKNAYVWMPQWLAWRYSNHKKECCKVGLKDKVIVLWPNNSKNAIDFTGFKYYHRLTVFSSLANCSNKIMICFCIQACNKARLTCSSCATNSMEEIHSRCSKFSLKWNTKSRIVLQNWITCFIHYQTVTRKRNSRKYWNKRSHKA